MLLALEILCLATNYMLKICSGWGEKICLKRAAASEKFREESKTKTTTNQQLLLGQVACEG